MRLQWGKPAVDQVLVLHLRLRLALLGFYRLRDHSLGVQYPSDHCWIPKYSGSRCEFIAGKGRTWRNGSFKPIASRFQGPAILHTARWSTDRIRGVIDPARASVIYCHLNEVNWLIGRCMTLNVLPSTRGLLTCETSCLGLYVSRTWNIGGCVRSVLDLRNGIIGSLRRIKFDVKITQSCNRDRLIGTSTVLPTQHSSWQTSLSWETQNSAIGSLQSFIRVTEAIGTPFSLRQFELLGLLTCTSKKPFEGPIPRNPPDSWAASATD